MSDAFSKITAIILAVCMMFIIPVFYMKAEQKRVMQTYILEEITLFVDGVRNTGIMTGDDYDRLQQDIFIAGGGYRIELMHCTHMKDESGQSPLYFENKFYTSQILEQYIAGGDYYLRKNDYLRVVVYDADSSIVAWYGGSIKYEAY